MERNLMTSMREITELRSWTDASNVHTFYVIYGMTH
jgi:hypothetical protein